MRNSLLLLAAGGIALLAAGCTGGASSSGTETGGSPSATTTGGSEQAATGKKFKIGVSIPAATHGWTGGVVYWANEAAKQHAADAEITVQTADKPEDQVSDLETMMNGGYDALVVLAMESDPLTPVAKQIKAKNIMLVSVDRGFTEPVADFYVRGDNRAFGRMAAEFMAEKLGGKGNIVMLEGMPTTINTERVEAFREELKKTPGITILDSQPGNWNQQKALEVTQAMLIKHPKIDAIWASDDDMAEGVLKALQEAKRDKNIWILGGAGKKEIIKKVMDKDPLFPGNITYPPSMIKDGIEAALQALKDGKRPEKQEDKVIELKVVTPENAKDFYFPDSPY